MPQVKPIPDGYHSVQPYLILNDAAAAIAFYIKAFGATEKFRMPGPGGRIGHAELQIGDSVVMLADESPQMDAFAPAHFGGSPISLLIYTADCDAVYAQAVACRRGGHPPARRPALWRPHVGRQGSLRLQVVHRDAHQGRLLRGNDCPGLSGWTARRVAPRAWPRIGNCPAGADGVDRDRKRGVGNAGQERKFGNKCPVCMDHLHSPSLSFR